MSLVLKMATSHYKRWCVLELAKKELEQLYRVLFARNFTRSQQAVYPFKPGAIPFNGKGAVAKPLILVGLLFLMHLWIVFGIASIADHKHQSVEQVLIFSYLRTTFPNSCASVHLWKAKSATGPGTGNRRFESAIRTLQRDTRQENDKNLPAKFTLVTRRRLLTSKRKLIGLLSFLENRKGCSRSDFSSEPFQMRMFRPPSSSW